MIARAQAAVPARRSIPTVVEAIPTPPTFREFVERFAKPLGMTKDAEIARAAGIHPSALSRWLSGAGGADVASLRQLANALEVRLAELMVAAGPGAGGVTAEEIGLEPLPDELQAPFAALRDDAPYIGPEQDALRVAIDYAYRQWQATVEVYRDRSRREPSHEERNRRAAR